MKTRGMIVMANSLFLAGIASVAACYKFKDVDQSAKPAPVIDLSTPDHALKSYWAQKEWLASIHEPEIDRSVERARSRQRDNMMKVTTGETAEYYSEFKSSPPEQFHREILSVKQETDSRAVALVRVINITPVPSGVEPTKSELQAERQANSFAI